MQKDSEYYSVVDDLSLAPLREYTLHGYISRQDFTTALHNLAQRWKGRIGEAVGERYDFLLLRFHDTPGGIPDEAWIPRYLLRPAGKPACLCRPRPSKAEQALDEAYGFD